MRGALGLLVLVAVALAGPAAGAVVWSDEPLPASWVLRATVAAGQRLLLEATDQGTGLVLQFGSHGLVASRRAAGRETRLAAAAARLPGPGPVLLSRSASHLAVSVGGATVLRLRPPPAAGARWGWLDPPAGRAPEALLQPTEAVWFSDDFMRQSEQRSVWQTVAGDWTVSQLAGARYSANAFRLVGRAPSDRPALTAAGEWFWDDLTIEASVQCGGSGGGVALGCRSGGAPAVLEYQAPPAGPRLRLLRFRAGRAEVLASRAWYAKPGDWHRFALSGVAGRLVAAVDGCELLQAASPELAPGSIGLWVPPRGVASFDDVLVYSGDRLPRRPVTLGSTAGEAPAESFASDQYMREWADERDQWLPHGGGVWHAGRFWGDVAVHWLAPAAGLQEPAELHLQAAPGPAAATSGRGQHLALLPQAGGAVRVELRDGNRLAAAKAVPPGSGRQRWELRRRGALVSVLCDDQELLQASTTQAAEGQIGLTAASATAQTGALTIVAQQVLDETFAAAPADWTIGSGHWGVSNRWACTPRWSWLQGRSRGLASIWTRRQFGGDLVAECYVGIPMDQPWAPFYQHPGNLALTIASAKGAPDSGYTFVFAGWGNTASGLFRNGELVQRVAGAGVPDILDALGGDLGRAEAHKLHNEWWHLRAERQGTIVRLTVDGRPVLQYDDPQPLPGGCLGIWTIDQAITVARTRVYYQAASQPVPSLDRPPAAALPPPLPFRASGPPRWVSSFESGLDGWQAGGPDGGRLSVVARPAPVGGTCLAVSRCAPGDAFEVRRSGLRVPVGALAFDYCLPPAARLDLFVEIAGRGGRVRLTGPPEPPPGCLDLGSVTDLRADGAWHTAVLDLLGRWRAAQPEAPVGQVEQLCFSSAAVAAYERYGLGGNPLGLTWQLDNLALGPATDRAVTYTVTPAGRVVAPGATVRRASAGLVVQPQRSGPLVVRLTAGHATAQDVLLADLAPPALRLLTDATPATPGLLRFAVADGGPAGLNEQTLRLRWDRSDYRLGHPALCWDALRQVLTVDRRRLPWPADAASVSVELCAADRLGHPAAPLRCSQPRPPTGQPRPLPPILAGLPDPLVIDSGADASGALQPWGLSAAAVCRQVPRAPGDPCREISITQLGGLGGLALRAVPFEATRYPWLSFDYRITAELRLDLILTVNGRRVVIKFCDNDQSWPVVGNLGASADGAWHHARIDLATALGGAGPLVVSELAFGSSGWPGNRAGTRWWLDNLRLDAVVAAPRGTAALRLSPDPQTARATCRWALTPSASAPAESDWQSGDLAAALAGQVGQTCWLHALGVGPAGEVSEPLCQPLRVVGVPTGEPLAIGEPDPAPGSSVCPDRLTIPLSSGVALSPADVRLSVAGRDWSLADAALRWDADASTLRWELPPGQSWGPPGSSLGCRLDLADLAGRRSSRAWRYRVDPTQPHAPPDAPQLCPRPASVAEANDFERDTGGWGCFLASQVLRIAEPERPVNHCLELRYLRVPAQGSGFVLASDFGEEWREHPWLRFRYRAVDAPGASLQVYGTTFDGQREQWTLLATCPAAGVDWQTADLDLAAALQPHGPTLELHRIFLAVGLPPDGVLLIDDYARYSPAATTAAWTWPEPSSASGIAGYSWVIDQHVTTTPPAQLRSTTRRAQATGLRPGRYTCHVRAVDRAGQWSQTSHQQVVLTAAR
ncbi:MAG: hypothetical protein IT204_02525 [Fimbriimonadaceae bacterium]|nr:hypothetical protein [Fimbriimonadaceae bacterium]